MIKEILEQQLTDSQKEYLLWNSDGTKVIIDAMDRSIINNSNTVSMVHWAKEHPINMKNISYGLSYLGFTKSITKKKWSELKILPAKLLEYVTQEKLDQYKIKNQLKKYMMRRDTKIRMANRVKAGKKILNTGLIRKGFQKVAKYDFTYDSEMITKYRPYILSNMVKSITKAISEGKIKDPFFENPANYQLIADMCLTKYEEDPEWYNLEYNNSDTRGRSIFQALKRIGNPVQFKDFRSLLVMSEPVIMSSTSTVELEDVYYFIAELTGSKATTEAGKFRDGKQAYLDRHLPELDLSDDEDLKDLHELIWLERIYTDLDLIFAGNTINWDIPLEVDASQSVAQIAGALTNDHRLLSSTNVIGYKLTDPWEIPEVRRTAGKLKGTPTFYGSSASAKQLINKKNYSYEQLLRKRCKDKGLEPTSDQLERAKTKDKAEIKAINKEFATGRFSVLNQMKDAIINGYNNHTPQVNINIWDDSYYVPVNKFKSAGAKLVVTEAWDTKSQSFKYSVTHEQELIPDYNYMKLYWQTGLIHNLDSQIINKIPLRVHRWMLTIHDAVVAGPGVCRTVRETYAVLLQEIHTNRFDIISSYRQSIGATDRKSDIAFMKLWNMTKHCKDTPTFKRTAMK